MCVRLSVSVSVSVCVCVCVCLRAYVYFAFCTGPRCFLERLDASALIKSPPKNCPPKHQCKVWKAWTIERIKTSYAFAEKQNKLLYIGRKLLTKVVVR